MKIGIIAERKKNADWRTPLTPSQCVDIQNFFDEIEIVVEPCNNRIFSNSEYELVGINLNENLSDCDVLLGVKEVPIEYLIPDKTYLFFSHTIKKQEQNKVLLQNILKKNITLIDYETLKWKDGKRIVGFGKYAGIVGAYNGLLAWGNKHHEYHLKPAYKCFDLNELYNECSKINKNKNLRIIVTGDGKVSNGAIDLLKKINIIEVDIDTFLYQEPQGPHFVQLDSYQLFQHIDGRLWDDHHFHVHHDEYKSIFTPYLKHFDILINGIYWDKKMPRLFEINDEETKYLKGKVIADISCDINGSIPFTIKETTKEIPTFGYDVDTNTETEAYIANTVEIMSVANLPTELPRDASYAFGEILKKIVIPEFLKKESAILNGATIAQNGKLGKYYQYLSDYIQN